LCTTDPSSQKRSNRAELAQSEQAQKAPARLARKERAYMKIILLRNGGFNRALQLSRRSLALGGTLALVGLCVVTLWFTSIVQSGQIDAQVVEQWRAKLANQRELVVGLEQKSQAQSAAVGKQLAQMQARLMRMEAIGAHLTESADLGGDEFDFGNPPAQGGPVHGAQTTLAWQTLEYELTQLSSQLKRRETELNILDSVLVSRDIEATSQVRGRPVTWGWVSSPFGKRVDPLTGKIAWHNGLDFAGRDGSDVIAVASGVVTFAGERSGYGKLVEISHADGLVTRYAHHKALVVSVGEVVKKGEKVGIMGSTGRSTGPHVHFEVVKNGRTVDPAKYVAGRS